MASGQAFLVSAQVFVNPCQRDASVLIAKQHDRPKGLCGLLDCHTMALFSLAAH